MRDQESRASRLNECANFPRVDNQGTSSGLRLCGQMWQGFVHMFVNDHFSTASPSTLFAAGIARSEPKWADVQWRRLMRASPGFEFEPEDGSCMQVAIEC